VPDSVSSEIPITVPPRVKHCTPQTPTEVEIPARTAVEIPTMVTVCGNPASSGYGQSLVQASQATDTTKCRDAFSGSVEDKETARHQTAGEVTAQVSTSTDAVSRGYSPSLSSQIPTITAADTLSLTADNRSSLSPPKLTPFWEQLDVLSDKSANMLDDMFPLNADDDPPFIGYDYDPMFDHLSELYLTAASGCWTDSSQTVCCRRRPDDTVIPCDSDGPCSPVKPASNTVSEVGHAVERVDSEIKLNLVSPWKQHGSVAAVTESCELSPGKSHKSRNSPGISNRNTDCDISSPEKFPSACSAQKCRRIISKNAEFHRGMSSVARSQRKSVSTADKDSEIDSINSGKFSGSSGKLGDSANGHASPRLFVDEDIAFNLASPQKLHGISCCSVSLKSGTPRRKIPTVTSLRKVGTCRRKTHSVMNSWVPSSVSGQ